MKHGSVNRWRVAAATLSDATEKVSRFPHSHPDGVRDVLRAGTASDRGAYTVPRPIHPVRPRAIAVRGAARLHGYPDCLRFHATKWNGFRQIGNPVPPPLARAVATAILAAEDAPLAQGNPVQLGPESLLTMTAGQAHDYYGLTQRVIPQRDRKASWSLP